MRVRPAEGRDRARAVDTLVRAFVDDPMIRFLAPGDAAYERVAAAFFGCLFDLRIDGGGEIRVTDDASSASLWNPPGGNRHGSEHVESVWSEQVVPQLDAGEREHMDEFDTALSSIHPEEPHWYLGVVGVDPERQGEGLGSAVIRAILDDPMAVGAPAYLVTATERNVPLYRHLGFEVCAETDLPDGPHLWGMWRSAASAG
jgi:ribosomal protein S18 acetylase RimI-like enzyme